jgi:predicted kinase
VCIETRQRFVLDNTHPTREERAPYIALARSAGFSVTAYHFDVPLGAALRRNERRAEGRRVPAKAVISTFHKLQPPAADEGFDARFRVTLDDSGQFTVEEWPLEV